MKKNVILAVLVAVLMMVTLCACGGNEPADTTTNTTTTTAATTTTTTQPDDGKVTYTVKVVDAEGNPIANAMVQLCLEACIPAPTNAEGVATWNLEEADYKVSFVVTPAGYAVEEAYYFEDGATDMTITLAAA